MSYSQWYLLKDLSDYGCIIYPCLLFLKLNMRNCGFLHQSEYYSVKNIFQKLSELNTFHLEIRQYFPYYCSELKTLEWDILNPDIHHSKVPSSDQISRHLKFQEQSHSSFDLDLPFNIYSFLCIYAKTIMKYSTIYNASKKNR